MTTAKEILELIENVSPDDTDKLDEIDARVWCYIYKTPFEKYFSISNGQTWVDCVHGSPSCDNYHYTRSRDALKAIRPDGYYGCVLELMSILDDINHNIKYRATIIILNEYKYNSFTSKNLPTEELAELYAVIQALEWERNNENT